MGKGFIFDDVAPREEDHMVEKAFEFVDKYDLEDAALLLYIASSPWLL